MSYTDCVPEDNVLRSDPCAIVLFGATGDLTRRKLIPALYSLHLKSHLPDKFAILAFARRDKSDDTFREDLRQGVSKFAPSLPSDGEEWGRFARLIRYHRADLDEISGYLSLRDRLTQLDEELG